MVLNDALPAHRGRSPRPTRSAPTASCLTCEPATRPADGAALLPVLSACRDCVDRPRAVHYAASRDRLLAGMRARHARADLGGAALDAQARRRRRGAARWRSRCPRAACCGRVTCSRSSDDWYLVVEALPEPVLAVRPARSRGGDPPRLRRGQPALLARARRRRAARPDDTAMEQLLTRLGVALGAATRGRSAPEAAAPGHRRGTRTAEHER